MGEVKEAVEAMPIPQIDLRILDSLSKLCSEFAGTKLDSRERAEIAAERLGLEVVTGTALTNASYGRNHTWNRKNGVIYDLAAKALDQSAPEVYAVIEDSDIGRFKYIEGHFITD